MQIVCKYVANRAQKDANMLQISCKHHAHIIKICCKYAAEGCKYNVAIFLPESAKHCAKRCTKVV